MTKNLDPVYSAGYLILGILMLALAGFCFTPTSITIATIQSFRVFGGMALIVVGIISFALKRDGVTPALFIVNGLMFLIAAGATLTSNKDFTLIVLAVGYLMLSLVMLLSKERMLLVSVLLLFIACNLISRYIFGTASDGTCIVGGVFCTLSALISLYIGMYYSSERASLPII